MPRQVSLSQLGVTSRPNLVKSHIFGDLLQIWEHMDPDPGVISVTWASKVG